MRPLFASALVFGSLIGPSLPATAQDLDSDLAGAPPAALSPELAMVKVDSSRYRPAQRRYDETAAALVDATSRRQRAEGLVVELAAREAELTADISRDGGAKREVAAALARVESGLRELAINAYVHSRNLDPVVELIQADAATTVGASRVMTDAVNADQSDVADDVQRDYDRLASALQAAGTERTEVRQRIDSTRTAHQQATADEARLAADLAVQQVRLEQVRALATVEGGDFPLVALDAYWRAARQLATDDPACGVPWWALAGITRVESRHGSYGGSRLLPNGDTAQPIIGIALDGTNHTRHIADTDGGALDGDIVVDRAVGPMQFIPSTWDRWARDGNGDGIANPHNLYDTAVTAARYLCASGPLTDDEGLARAFFSYNHSDAYVANVLGWAHTYATIAVPPVGSAV